MTLVNILYFMFFYCVFRLVDDRMRDFIVSAGIGAEDEWYNKSLSALRMNSSHHPNLSTPILQYQT